METIQITDNVRQALATMAIENIYLEKGFVEKLVKMDKREVTGDELRQELMRKYAR